MRQVIKKKIAEKYNIDTTNYTYTLVCDGSSILKACLVSDKLNSDGKEYGSIINFFNIIKTVLERRDFSKCYVFFDDNFSGQKRFEIYHDYKQNREDKKYDMTQISDYDKQINDYIKKVLSYSKTKKVEVKRGETDDERYQRSRDIVFQMCDELYIRTYMSEYVEADDLIAYTVQHGKPNEKFCIISGDRDLSQLISKDVCLYTLQNKHYVTHENSVAELGILHENVVLMKIFCGDVSDNIKGIKGCGEKTFIDLFPDVLEHKVSVDDIIAHAKEINESRAKEKKKPLKVCENIINSITDGIQGKDIYNINEKIISLEKPLLTEESENFMKDFIDSPLDGEGRSFENLYKIICDNKFESLMDSDKFSNFFSVFNGLIYREKHFYD